MLRVLSLCSSTALNQFIRPTQSECGDELSLTNYYLILEQWLMLWLWLFVMITLKARANLYHTFDKRIIVDSACEIHVKLSVNEEIKHLFMWIRNWLHLDHIIEILYKTLV